MLAERLKMLREECGLKQETLANEIGCTRYMISYYENGREPSNDIIRAYCNRFNVSADFLLGLSNERKPASGKLSGIFESIATVSNGAAPTATDLSLLLETAVRYYRKGAPCGDAPMTALTGFCVGLRDALNAATAGDTPALIDGANAAVIAALDVTKMPATYYESKGEESQP